MAQGEYRRTSNVAGAAWITLVGGVLLAVGSFLPWATAQIFVVSLNRNGMQLGQNDSFSLDGLVTLILGLVTVLIGVGRLSNFAIPRYIQRSAIVAGFAAGAIAIYDINSVRNLVDTQQSAAPGGVFAVGYGIYVVVSGAVIAVLGGLILRTNDTQLDDRCPFCESKKISRLQEATRRCLSCQNTWSQPNPGG